MTAGGARPLAIDLDGCVAIVTGAGAGIGRGIALSLAGCGAHVAVIDIDAARAEQTTTDARAFGREALALPADVMDTDSLRAAVRAVDGHFGRIDALVNNAGGVASRRFLDQSERSWRRHIDINLVSMLAMTAASVPVMIREGRGGSVLNIASIEATRAAPTFAVYAACKAGMVSFTRTMAVELAEHDVRVNALAPDWTRTPGNSGLRRGPVPDELPERPPEVRELLEAYVPLGREGTVEEIGQVAAFLCSPLAGYVTGAVIPVDGGTWASSGWTRAGERWSLFGHDHPM